MKIVISPAKSLDFETELPTQKQSLPAFLDEAILLDKYLKKKSPKQLMRLMGISEKLAYLNWERNQERDLTAINEDTARPAVFAFNGDVYTGLDAYSIPLDKIDILQNKLRILSGLYGILKPLDLIQPYRLEMGTTFPVARKKNLYEYWKPKLTAYLNNEIKEGELFINLASTEYFGAIDVKKMKTEVITPEFKDYKNGQLKMISFFAKKARGMMVRYILDTNAETIEDLKGFNYEGYVFDSALSKKNKLVYTR